MKKFNSVGILLVAIVIAGVVIFFIKGRQTRESVNLDAPFRFLGLTNIGPANYATFQLSNRTDGQLAYAQKDFQIKNADGSWQTNRIRSVRQWRGYGDNLLEAHHEIIFSVPVPTNGVPWKLHLMCQEHSTGLSGAEDRVDDAVRNTKDELKARPNGAPAINSTKFSGRQYDVVSEEIASQ